MSFKHRTGEHYLGHPINGPASEGPVARAVSSHQDISKTASGEVGQARYESACCADQPRVLLGLTAPRGAKDTAQRPAVAVTSHGNRCLFSSTEHGITINERLFPRMRGPDPEGRRAPKRARAVRAPHCRSRSCRDYASGYRLSLRRMKHRRAAMGGAAAGMLRVRRRCAGTGQRSQ